jgi:LL-diaminopimelate aminotransferase
MTSTSLDIARLSQNLGSLPPYVFAELDRLKADARQRGIRFDDLGIGSPDRPTPPSIVEALQRAAADPATHGYPPFRGVPMYRDAVRRFMQRRFGVQVDVTTEVLALAGSKEGIAQIITATVGIGDVVLVPEIYYPVYARASLLTGAEVHFIPMRESTGFLADFDSVPRDVLRRSRILIVNYPNNPTGAVSERDYFEHAVEFDHQHGLILVSDLAYSQLTFDGFVAPSALEIPGAKDVTIEFHSCSKSFNMAGVRVGFAVGAASLIDARCRVPDERRLWRAVGGAVRRRTCVRPPCRAVRAGCRHVSRARDAITNVMRRMGQQVKPPRGAMYLWHRVPNGVDDWAFVRAMLEDARVVVTPAVHSVLAAQGTSGSRTWRNRRCSSRRWSALARPVPRAAGARRWRHGAPDSQRARSSRWAAVGVATSRS